MYPSEFSTQKVKMEQHQDRLRRATSHLRMDIENASTRRSARDYSSRDVILVVALALALIILTGP